MEIIDTVTVTFAGCSFAILTGWTMWGIYHLVGPREPVADTILLDRVDIETGRRPQE